MEYEGQEGAVVGAAAAGGVAGAAIASAESPEGKTKADVLAPGTPTQSEVRSQCSDMLCCSKRRRGKGYKHPFLLTFVL